MVDRLYFKSDAEGFHSQRRDHLHLFDLASRSAVALTRGPWDDSEPVFSPDGRKLCWTSGRTADAKSQLFLADWNDPAAMAALLSDPRLTDPLPTSPGGLIAALPDKSGDPALDTADWAANRNVKDNLRVDYVLPSADLTVTAAGVFWPLPDDPMARIAAAASPHRLDWVDITLP